jgi:hypothetical protein
MRTQRSLLLSSASTLALLVIFEMLGLSSYAAAQSNNHPNEIWGSVRTQARSTANIFKNVVINVHKVNSNQVGPVVASTQVVNRSNPPGTGTYHYAVNMGNLPAGKYLVKVLPIAGSEYGAGERLINYPGAGGSVRQDWTLVLGQPAVPAKE